MDPPPPSPTDSHIGGPLLSGCAHLIVFLVNFSLTDNLVLFIILMLIYLKHSFGFIFTGRSRKLLRPSTSSSTMHSSVRRQLVKKSQELLHDLIVVVFFRVFVLLWSPVLVNWLLFMNSGIVDFATWCSPLCLPFLVTLEHC